MSSDSKDLILQSSDGEDITVERDIAEYSNVIKNMLAYLGKDAVTEPIPILRVNANVLKKVVELCRQHKSNAEWEQGLMQVDQEMLSEIILAANYLDIKVVQDAAYKTVANMIHRKSAEEMRRILNIPNDFTPEEEEQMRRENEWAEE
ncbi:hypothetical protein DV735_g2564, partial [Chaetothyriales sp. CBS 134920]